MRVHRRRMLGLTASSVVLSSVAARAAMPDIDRVRAAVARFAALPVTASCAVAVDGANPWQVAHAPSERLFVGSAVKTFILAQFLRDVEAGKLTEEQQVTIDDGVRSLSSPVFLNLSGTTAARNVLEAMIAHSDNTATDVALAAVGPDPVRALIAEAGLTNTRIPESTRRLFSYVAGAPEGVDIGWSGAQRVMKDEKIGTPRSPMNDVQSMVSTADELVRWYRAALRGTFFAKPATLTEFKRIQGLADSLIHVVPPDVAAYGKGGSIDWANFHCFALAGQMVVGKTPVTFCFTINWTGPDDGVPKMFAGYAKAVVDVLGEVAKVAA
jgi:beta-lactamase class A